MKSSLSKRIGTYFSSQTRFLLASFVLIFLLTLSIISLASILPLRFTPTSIFVLLLTLSLTASILLHPLSGIITTLLASLLAELIPTYPLTSLTFLDYFFLNFFGLTSSLLITYFHHQSRQTTYLATHFQKLANISLNPIIIKDADGCIKFASHTIVDLLGYPNRALYQKEITQFLHPDDFPKYHRFFRSVINSPETKQTVTIRVKHKNGQWLWLKNEAINHLQTEHIHSIVSSLQDVTKQKQLKEERLRILKAEQKAREEAENAVRARDEFLSIASHELKTPLTTILLHLRNTIKRTRTQSLADFSGESLVKSLNIAEKQSQRLTQMIKDLLNLSLISTGRIELHYQEGDLRELLHHLIDSLSEQIKHSQSSIELEAPQPVLGIWDLIRIEQIFTNLLTNALKFGAGKPITIKLHSSDQTAVVEFTNLGEAISPSEINHIFELFYQGKSSLPTKGLGVGLYISRAIAESHGGDITCTSDPTSTTFTVTLPLSPNS